MLLNFIYAASWASNCFDKSERKVLSALVSDFIKSHPKFTRVGSTAGLDLA